MSFGLVVNESGVSPSISPPEGAKPQHTFRSDEPMDCANGNNTSGMLSPASSTQPSGEDKAAIAALENEIRRLEDAIDELSRKINQLKDEILWPLRKDIFDLRSGRTKDCRSNNVGSEGLSILDDKIRILEDALYVNWAHEHKCRKDLEDKRRELTEKKKQLASLKAGAASTDN